MGTEKRHALTVVYAATALKQLDEIWDWNEERYGADHADQYVAFLEKHIDALGIDHRRGRPVGVRPDLSYLLIRRKSRGHGHIAVYQIESKQVKVLFVFHSAQDWQGKLAQATT